MDEISYWEHTTRTRNYPYPPESIITIYFKKWYKFPKTFTFPSMYYKTDSDGIQIYKESDSALELLNQLKTELE